MKKFSTSHIQKTLYLMRHGKADYNKYFEDGGYVEVHGQLSEEGREQVYKSAQELNSLALGERVLIVTSPKRRCFQTADIVINMLGKNREICVNVEHGFRDVNVLTRCSERPCGSYHAWESDLQASETWYDGWMRCSAFYPGEEDPVTLLHRVKTNFMNLALDATNLIVCHEEVMLALAKLLDLAHRRPDYAEVWQINPAQ